MAFLGGWLSGVFTCWLFAKIKRIFLPLKPQSDVMSQTDPFIAPGVCDLAVFPTGAKYEKATFLGPCLDCFEFQLKSRIA